MYKQVIAVLPVRLPNLVSYNDKSITPISKSILNSTLVGQMTEIKPRNISRINATLNIGFFCINNPIKYSATTISNNDENPNLNLLLGTLIEVHSKYATR